MIQHYFLLRIFSPSTSQTPVKLEPNEAHAAVDIPTEAVGSILQYFLKIYGPDVRIEILPNDLEWARQ